MSEPFELIQGIDDDRRMMMEANKESRERGIALAKAEAAYQAWKHRRILELKAQGMPATLIQQAIKGDPYVLRYLFARDCARSEYESAKEEVNIHKLSARLQEQQLQREWNESGGIL